VSQLNFEFLNKISSDNYKSSEFIKLSENINSINIIEDFFESKAFHENPFKSLIISGSKYCGKTHLSYVLRDKFDVKYFDNYSILNKDLKNLFQPNQFYIIDNCDNNDEEKLLQIINYSYENKALMIFIMQNNQQFALADLNSRIKNIHKLVIQDPNYASSKEILINILSRKQIYLNNQIINYILTSVPLSYQSIVESCLKIEHYVNEHNVKISLQIIKKIL
jgi:chromosomal replication initiation ATPase DnaA